MSLDASSTVDVRPSILKLALANDLPARALSVSIIVGTVLTLINQGDLLFFGQAPDFWKMGLTYLVPYCVATYGAVSAMQKAAAAAEPDWSTQPMLAMPAPIEPALPAPSAAPAELPVSSEGMRRLIAAAAADAAALRDAAQATTSLLAAAERDAAQDAGAASRRAADTVETLARLARQTHLAALNASLEAVRAGTAGDGLATIAGDLNQLARRIMAGTDELRRHLALDGDAPALAGSALRDAVAAAERQRSQAAALAARIESLNRDVAAD